MCPQRYYPESLSPLPASSSMDWAIFTAFQTGDFEPILDRLTLASMNFAREVDGTTPLMAACARGNAMVVQLLLDLQCDAWHKDKNGLYAADHAAMNSHSEMKDVILERCTPSLDKNGNPLFSWDTCSHPAVNKYLDIEQGWLVCTNCALVLKENALSLTEFDSIPSKHAWSVRGADAEYNAWRYHEMEISNIMSNLGIVDNENAKRLGIESSIWAKRERALAWLDDRRRAIKSAENQNELSRLKGLEDEHLPTVKTYSAKDPALMPGMSSQAPWNRSKGAKARTIKVPRFVSHHCPKNVDLNEEPEDLIDPRELLDAIVPQEVPTRWKTNVRRWESLSVKHLRSARRSSLLSERELEDELGEERDRHEVELEMEIY
ncbi:hypothetical protein GUITHDRAFT_108298 [Guillardia theta CCMP2712]|uniref:Uncharacterized protein n=1 Tax=Guillardia theta (strain CCMP2712) TaxID=905079 RepID=L1JCL5_GUITC|nr:hypothetical protein GUITHDRAFT_108298 [Guillardia theta CCMP2712]EKX45849.1 hypothetical protein GUITHDRAFT_108298 [Guillardia theta CCMP2712]|eukprot:XP_005832829.1 hypothetical protein GUITHDRAFT_108298 [Guillardia theta CCMP2712]